MKNKSVLLIVIFLISLLMIFYVSIRPLKNKDIEITNLKEQLDEKNAIVESQDIELKQLKEKDNREYEDYVITSDQTYNILEAMYRNDTNYILDNSVEGTKIENNKIYFGNDDIAVSIPEKKLDLWNRGYGKQADNEMYLFYNIWNKNDSGTIASLELKYVRIEGQWKLARMDYGH